MQTLQQDLERLTAQRPARPIGAQRALTLGPRSEAYASLVEHGRAHGIGFIRALALLLKWETEHQVGSGNAEDFGGHVLLSEWPVRELRAALDGAFEDGDVADLDDFNLLVTELRLLGLDRVATDSDALAYFARQHGLTREQAARADPTTCERYDSRKSDWLRLNEALGDLCLMREDRAMRAEGLRQSFLQIFALEFLDERSQLARLEIARLRLDLIREHPALTAAEIEEELALEIANRTEALNRHQLSAIFGLQPRTEIRDNDAPDDLATAKHLLRKIAMLIHPDRLAGLPLTDAQRRRLMMLWHDANRCRIQPGDGGMLCRSNDALRRTLREAEQTLGMAGIADLDPASTIQGATLDERIEWLDDACAALEQRVTSIQAELFALGTDQELNYMRALLHAPEHVQEKERGAMSANADRYRMEADTCEARARELLAKTV